MKWLSLLRSSHVISKFLHSLFRSVCLSCFKIKMSDRIKPNGWTLDPLIPVDRTIPHAYKNAFRTEFLGTLANQNFWGIFPSNQVTVRVILVNEKQGVTWWGNKLPPFANFALNIDNDNSWYAMFTSDILDSFGAKAYHSNL